MEKIEEKFLERRGKNTRVFNFHFERNQKIDINFEKLVNFWSPKNRFHISSLWDEVFASLGPNLPVSPAHSSFVENGFIRWLFSKLSMMAWNCSLVRPTLWWIMLSLKLFPCLNSLINTEKVFVASCDIRFRVTKVFIKFCREMCVWFFQEKSRLY